MLPEKTRRLTPGGGFSCDRGTFAPLAGFDNSGGTGKPAVAFEAARSNAHAALARRQHSTGRCAEEGLAPDWAHESHRLSRRNIGCVLARNRPVSNFATQDEF